MTGIPHVLTYAEAQRGIYAIAEALTGDGNNWPQIAQYNNLRPPYVTTNPVAVYGSPVAVLTLPITLTAGSTFFDLSGLPYAINLVYLSGLVDGTFQAESLSILNYNGTRLLLETPIQYNWPTGTLAQFFLFTPLSGTTVLLPQQTLYIPSSLIPNSLVGNNVSLVEIFGSDLQNPLTITNGTLATVSGYATLIQRIQIALQTAVGSYALHPTFGSLLPASVGEPVITSTTRWTAILRECLLQLPEIADVTHVQLQPLSNANGLSVTAQIVPTGSTQFLTIQNVPILLS